MSLSAKSARYLVLQMGSFVRASSATVSACVHRVSAFCATECVSEVVLVLIRGWSCLIRHINGARHMAPCKNLPSMIYARGGAIFFAIFKAGVYPKV